MTVRAAKHVIMHVDELRSEIQEEYKAAAETEQILPSNKESFMSKTQRTNSNRRRIPLPAL